MIVANRTDQSLLVRMDLPRYRPPHENAGSCAREIWPLRVAKLGEERTDAYTPAEIVLRDTEACEIQIRIPARHQAVVNMNGSCSDYEKHRRQHPEAPPPDGFLRVEGVEGTIELRGWQLAQYFKRKSNRCELSYPR